MQFQNQSRKNLAENTAKQKSEKISDSVNKGKLKWLMMWRAFKRIIMLC